MEFSISNGFVKTSIKLPKIVYPWHGELCNFYNISWKELTRYRKSIDKLLAPLFARLATESFIKIRNRRFWSTSCLRHGIAQINLR